MPRILPEQIAPDEAANIQPPPQPDHFFTHITEGNISSRGWFSEFLNRLDLPAELDHEDAKLIGRPRHRALMVKLGQRTWQSGPLRRHWNGSLKFTDPAMHFNTHLEAQAETQRPSLTVFLHFETNPYYSIKDLKSLANATDLATFERFRGEFIAEFERNCDWVDFQFRPDVVQIGKSDIDYRDMTIQQIGRWLEAVTASLHESVQRTLHQVVDDPACNAA